MRRDTAAALFTLGMVVVILIIMHGFLGAQAPALSQSQIRPYACCEVYWSFGPPPPPTCNAPIPGIAVYPGLGAEVYVTGTVGVSADTIYRAENDITGTCRWVQIP